MESIIHELMDRYWIPPMCERQNEEVEHYRELLKPLFSPQQRKWLLRLIDAKDAVREISERDAFACGFRLAMELNNEIQSYGRQLIDERQPDACRLKKGAKTYEKNNPYPLPDRRVCGAVCRCAAS